MSDYVLGLDLGTTSIGWAVVDASVDESGKVLKELGLRAAGVRIFPEGVNRDSRGAEVPKSVERRTARGARRNRYRRAQRRRNLVRALVEADLLPRKEAELNALWQLDPYELRARGLKERLSLHEFGRVIFHLNQRRGFKSNRKSGSAAEDKGILKEMNDLQAAVNESGARTLGEYFCQIAGEEQRNLVRNGTRIRGHHTFRSMYAAEMDALWSAQSRFHGSALTDELRDRIRDEILLYQRPLKPQTHLIGICELERSEDPNGKVIGEPRCPRSDWFAQQFRVLTEVANLRICEPDGVERALSSEERTTIVELLSSSREKEFSKLADAIGLDDGAQFNLQRGQRRKLAGNTAEAALSSALTKRIWEHLSDADKEIVRCQLTESEDGEDLRAELQRLGASEQAIEKLLAYEGPTGYAQLSRVAMQKLIPHLLDGRDLQAAKKAAGYLDPSARVVQVHTQLQEPPDLPNPIVRAALVEVRKVVNEVIRIHGRPARVVIELARDMREGAQKRKERSFENRERERDREEIRKRLITEFGLTSPSRQDVETFLLWREQDEECPYTGRKIPQGQLFSGAVAVDHILPRWRSLDDSYLNKVVCFHKANQDKGDRTPREWKEGTADYDDMLERVRAMKSMPFPKKRRFSQQEIDLDSFVQRQLNDTRYICTRVREYIGTLYDPEERASRVRASRGQLTAELRRQWQLNGILSAVLTGPDSVDRKSRDDHRHHAIDAVVVALSQPSHLKALADYHKRRARLANKAPTFTPPWDDFRSSVSGVINQIMVSHAPQRRLSGGLHEATFYGPTSEPGEYVYRKPISKLSTTMIQKVRDPAIRTAIEARLAEFGWAGAGAPIPKGALDDPKNPPRMQSGMPIKRVRIVEKIGDPVEFTRPGSERPFRVAIRGNNHHTLILGKIDAPSAGAVDAIVVSTFEAAERARRKRVPVIDRSPRPGHATLMALSIGDSVFVADPETGDRRLYRVQKMSSRKAFADILLRDARDARPAADAGSGTLRVVSAGAWNRLSIEKVSVSPAGIAHTAGI